MSTDQVTPFTIKLRASDKQKLRALQANLEPDYGHMSIAGVVRFAVSRLAAARGVMVL